MEIGSTRSVFSGGDKIGLGWVENEIDLGWINHALVDRVHLELDVGGGEVE